MVNLTTSPIEKIMKEVLQLTWRGKIDSALEQCAHYLQYVKPEEEAYILRVLAEIYISKADFPKAIECCYKGISYARIYKLICLEGRLYNMLGIAHNRMACYQEAIKYQEKTIEIGHREHCLELEMSGRLNVATSYIGLEQPELAMQEVGYVLGCPEIRDNHNIQCVLNLNLAKIYRLRRDYEQAKHAINEAIALGKRYQFVRLTANAYQQLAFLAEEQGDYKAAIAWCDQALERYIEMGNKMAEAKCYQEMAKIYELVGDFKNAFVFLKCYVEIEDELLNLKNLQDIIVLKKDNEYFGNNNRQK